MKLTKSKERVKKLGEVFTPPVLIEEILDKLPASSWLPEKTFLEPSCGTGNFCVAILQRKLQAGHTPLQALSTLYGIDIMQDNVDECRSRLVEIAVEAGLEKEVAEAAVKRNIIVGDALKLDFSGDWPAI